MPGVSSEDQVIFEDLEKAAQVLDQRQTPFLTAMRKGKRPEAMTYFQAVDKMGKRIRGGVPEGRDIQGYEGDKTRKIGGRVERFQRWPHVTVEAEELNRTAGVSSASAYNEQVTKKIKENNRDIDHWILSDQESKEDDGVTGYWFRGAGRTINDGTTGAATSAEGDASMAFTDTQTAIPASLRTPTAQIYAGTLAAFLEANLNTMMQTRWAHSGAMANFTLWVGSLLKGQISDNFGRYQPNKTNFTPILRTSIADIDKKKLVTSGIDVYEGDYGTMTVELEPWMPTTARGYGMEMNEVEKRVLYQARHNMDPSAAAKGGGKRGLIDSILGAWFGDPRKHFKICPSDEVAAVVDFEQ